MHQNGEPLAGTIMISYIPTLILPSHREFSNLISFTLFIQIQQDSFTEAGCIWKTRQHVISQPNNQALGSDNQDKNITNHFSPFYLNVFYLEVFIVLILIDSPTDQPIILATNSSIKSTSKRLK